MKIKTVASQLKITESVATPNISRTIHGNTQMTTTYLIKYIEVWCGYLCSWY